MYITWIIQVMILIDNYFQMMISDKHSILLISIMMDVLL